tara:strand:+ start:5496 stop:5795 length:300 start_codon:yes stop_codon:yes gene_type:complete
MAKVLDETAVLWVICKNEFKPLTNDEYYMYQGCEGDQQPLIYNDTANNTHYILDNGSVTVIIYSSNYRKEITSAVYVLDRLVANTGWQDKTPVAEVLPN